MPASYSNQSLNTTIGDRNIKTKVQPVDTATSLNLPVSRTLSTDLITRTNRSSLLRHLLIVCLCSLDKSLTLPTNIPRSLAILYLYSHSPQIGSLKSDQVAGLISSFLHQAQANIRRNYNPVTSDKKPRAVKARSVVEK